MKKKYGIKVLANLSGVLPHTLRVWEQRYQMFCPERSDGGTRLYSKEDLKKARLLSRLTKMGHSISSLAQYSVKELEGLAADFRPEEGPIKEVLFQLDTFFNSLKDFRLDKIAEELQYLRAGLGAKDFIFQVALPLLREIGEFVARGDFTVTQEHVISSLLREQIFFMNFPENNLSGIEIALATPEGNIHELSILIANVLCRYHRFGTRYLGAAHPADCLGQAINALKSPYLVLGVVSSDQWDLARDLPSYLKKLDGCLNRELTVILGGAINLAELPDFGQIKKIIPIETFLKFDQFLQFDL